MMKRGVLFVAVLTTGDAKFDGATVRIDITGPQSFDEVVVTGAATLTDATIALNFIDNYGRKRGRSSRF